jgi:hypothetical protein
MHTVHYSIGSSIFNIRTVVLILVYTYITITGNILRSRVVATTLCPLQTPISPSLIILITTFVIFVLRSLLLQNKAIGDVRRKDTAYCHWCRKDKP